MLVVCQEGNKVIKILAFQTVTSYVGISFPSLRPFSYGADNVGAIVDTLVLGPRELSIIKGEYPQCVSRNLTNSDHAIQEYRIIIADEEENSYYDFLVANLIAGSSNKFHWRFKSDQRFADSMKSRLEGNS